MDTGILAPRIAHRSRGCATVVTDLLGRPRCYTPGPGRDGRDLEAELAILAPEYVRALDALVHALLMIVPDYARAAGQAPQDMRGVAIPLSEALVLIQHAHRRGITGPTVRLMENQA